MLHISILIFSAILLSFSTFISAKGKLTDNRYKGFRKVTKGGKKLILLNFVILLLLIVQYFLNNYELKQSNDKIISSVTEEIGKIPDNPVLICTSIDFYKRINEGSIYKITLTSLDASSSDFNIKCSFFGGKPSGLLRDIQFIGNKIFLTETDRLPKDFSASYYYEIPNDSLFTMIYFRMTGTYKSPGKTRPLPIDEYYYYNAKSKTDGRVTGQLLRAVLKEIFEKYANK
jgi:hypothetical protein